MQQSGQAPYGVAMPGASTYVNQSCQRVGYDRRVVELDIGSYPMPAGIESIVSAYVRLTNRQALEDMRELRRQLLRPLQGRSSNGAALSRDSIFRDLRVIEDALEQLRPPQHG